MSPTCPIPPWSRNNTALLRPALMHGMKRGAFFIKIVLNQMIDFRGARMVYHRQPIR